jgi:hypothetical protein
METDKIETARRAWKVQDSKGRDHGFVYLEDDDLISKAVEDITGELARFTVQHYGVYEFISGGITYYVCMGPRV